MPSLAHLLNQSPEFQTRLPEQSLPLRDDGLLLSDPVTQTALPPEPIRQVPEWWYDLAGHRWFAVFGGVWLPPGK